MKCNIPLIMQLILEKLNSSTTFDITPHLRQCTYSKYLSTAVIQSAWTKSKETIFGMMDVNVKHASVMVAYLCVWK
jgi:hypothetical protein